MSILSYSSNQCKITRYCGGYKNGTCLDIIPQSSSKKIQIKSIEEAQNIVTILKDFIRCKRLR